MLPRPFPADRAAHFSHRGPKVDARDQFGAIVGFLRKSATVPFHSNALMM